MVGHGQRNPRAHLLQRLTVLFLIGLQMAIGLSVMRPVEARTPVTYYVDARNGRDTNDGKSPGRAWRTIAQANALVQPGDTVIIQAGVYREPIAPVVSGTAQARITYRAAQGQTVIIEGVELLLNLIQRSYITVQGITFQNPTGAWGEIQNGSYNEIIGNTFIGNGYTPYYAGLYLYNGSVYNRLINNEFRNWGDRYAPGDEQAWGDAVRLSRGADCTLIEGNRFINGGHALLGIDTSYNVIRNNYFENAWHKGIDMVWRVNPPWARGEEFIARRNLIEYNTFVRCRIGADGAKGGAGVQIGSAETIFRRNVLVENERMGVIINGWADAPNPYGNRVYHNTFVDNGTDESNPHASGVMITNWGQSQVNISDNVLKNNIICRTNAQKHQLFFYIFPDRQFGESFYRSYMVAGNVVNQRPLMNVVSLDGLQRIGHYQQRYSQFVRDNLEAEPLFVDKAAGNYRLRDGSPGIDAAVPLTWTKTGGNGTVVSVEDASYFTNGFGLVAGDQVKIGSNPPVEVVDVNIERDTLTFARAIRWSQGDPVYLGEFHGRAPDIGAFESAAAPPAPSLRVVAPNGGEQWRVGETVTIRWSSSNLTGPVNIELSRDGGRQFAPLMSGVLNDGEETWLVSGTPTTRAVIRISSATTLSVNDSSDAVFTIVEPKSLRVVSPNGGEQWKLGRQQTIQWVSTGLAGNVMVRLSRDGGRTYRTIFRSIPNTGSVSWKPNGLATANCLIEVISLDDETIHDRSDAPFSLTR
ncbi:MAG: right-handed parallel beta-helix repeat-containing protein [Blastocatellia bacterium]|nr:right-handed parallel beta-helix repeat-containing protein [Blastocatellia bacterium]